MNFKTSYFEDKSQQLAIDTVIVDDERTAGLHPYILTNYFRLSGQVVVT